MIVCNESMNLEINHEILFYLDMNEKIKKEKLAERQETVNTVLQAFKERLNSEGGVGVGWGWGWGWGRGRGRGWGSGSFFGRYRGKWNGVGGGGGEKQ